MALDAFPHPTLLYLKWQAETGEPNAYHLFDGHAESVKFEWVQWLFFPELLVMRHWAGFMDTNPVLAGSMIVWNLCAFFTHAGIFWGIAFRFTHADTVVEQAVQHVTYNVIVKTQQHSLAGIVAVYVLFAFIPSIFIDMGFWAHLIAGFSNAVLGFLAMVGVAFASVVTASVAQAIGKHHHDHSLVRSRSMYLDKTPPTARPDTRQFTLAPNPAINRGPVRPNPCPAQSASRAASQQPRAYVLGARRKILGRARGSTKQDASASFAPETPNRGERRQVVCVVVAAG